MLLATSADGRTWSPAAELFSAISPTGSRHGVQNEAFAETGGRLYGVAHAARYCAKPPLPKPGPQSGVVPGVGGLTWDSSCVGNASHFQGPFPLLMRRILGPTSFGPIFWLQPTAPAGYPSLPTYLSMAAPAREDAVAHLSSLVNVSVPSLAPAELNSAGACGSDGCVPYQLTVQGERSLYALPGAPTKLVMLARIGPGRREYGKLAHQCASAPYAHDNCSMWAAACELPASSREMGGLANAVKQVSCAPGTGYNMLQVLSDGLSPHHAGATAPRQCNWSTAELVNIPDAASRSCTAALPPTASGAPGGVWLVSNTPSTSHPFTDGRRETLTLSLSKNGLEWDRHLVVRDRDTVSPIRFPGYGKYPGFQYPAGMWRRETGEMLIVYSEGKENISVTAFPLSSLPVRLKLDDDEEARPVVSSFNASALAIIRQLVASNRLPHRLAPALAALRRAADTALGMEGRALQPRGGVAPPGTSEFGCPERGPWSVTAKAIAPPSGNLHDYTFLNTYSWPCNLECNVSIFGAARCKDWWHHQHEVGPNRTKCDNATGLPWSMHDGFGQYHGQHDTNCGGLMVKTATTLARAYYLTQNESYAAGAASVLRTWFLDAPTAMRPNLNYGAFVPGVENGSCYGIIATSFDWNSEVTDALVLLEGSRHWSAADAAGMRRWNARYLDWLIGSSLGLKEFNQSNNHFTWLMVEALALAWSTGNAAVAHRLAARARSADYRGCLQNQISADGLMTHEASREGGATYSVMNLRGLFSLATLAAHSSANDLWTWRETSSGRGSIKKALDYLLTFATNASRPWPFSEDGNHTAWWAFPWTELAPLMRRASAVFGEDAYEQNIADLPWRSPRQSQQQGLAKWQADVNQLLWPKLTPADAAATH